jgi:hypothetical protein
MSIYIPIQLRRRIRELDRNRGAYCHSPEALMGVTFEIEHILPVSLGGEPQWDNLCLSCPTCNRHKANRSTALDPQHGEDVSLFHPRQQRWNDHFTWMHDGTQLKAFSSAGRATLEALHANRLAIVRLRRYWVVLNLHPPQEDNKE